MKESIRHAILPLIICSITLAQQPKIGDADYPKPSPSKRHDEKVIAVKNGDFDVVLIGDSITHTLSELGGKYAPMKKVWQTHLAPFNALNLGYNGYRTEQILWNLKNGELEFKRSPKVFVLLIGTNNTDDRHFSKVHTAEQVYEGTQAIVETIRKRHPKSQVLVLRIFPRGGDDQTGVSPPDFNSSPQCIRTCKKAGELTRKLADDEHIHWLDINHVFLTDKGKIDTRLMWDLLHPSPEGADAWVQAILPKLRDLMQKADSRSGWTAPDSLNELPETLPLPDLMKFHDGKPVKTVEDWQKRREELKAALLYYQYGRMPGKPDQVKVVESATKPHASGLGTVESLTLQIDSQKKLQFRTVFYVPDPKKHSGRRPVILREEGRLGHRKDAPMFLEKGYIFVEYARHDLDPDRDRVVGTAQAAYPNHDWATLSVWAWCGMRLVDYLETRPDVDMQRIGITGHSRGGKMALLTAALDERIALAVPHQSGSGGAGSYRILSPGAETLAHNDKPHWYHERLRWFWEKEERLPFDQHTLKALVAPRALLCTESLDDEFANPLGTVATSVAAQRVFDFLGSSEKNAFHFRRGRHSTTTEDWKRILEFAEWHFFDRKPANSAEYWMEAVPLPREYKRGFKRELSQPKVKKDLGPDDYFMPVDKKVHFDFVTIDDTGNRADKDHHGQGRYGAVTYPYRLAEQQVTQQDYAIFLNAVAKLEAGDLYHSRMANGDSGIRQIKQGEFHYLVSKSRRTRPVVYVSWRNAAMFCNWLHHGQSTDVKSLLNGAYDLTQPSPQRNPQARYFLPSADEWYKAAYFQPAGAENSRPKYLHFAPNEDDRPIITTREPDYFSPLKVGGLADSIWEWTDSPVGKLHRAIRSAAWFRGNNKQAAGHFYTNPEIAYPSLGFRVATPK